MWTEGWRAPEPSGCGGYEERPLTLVVIKSPLFRSPKTHTALANSRKAMWNSTWVLDIAQHKVY